VHGLEGESNISFDAASASIIYKGTKLKGDKWFVRRSFKNAKEKFLLRVCNLQ
jgi:hypothetical protein